ncbi:MAG: tRNA lysidine(34) synthetase TilS [Candidatus Kapabacteria bacterium]|nr:tRNA lysidine(34) synthetase TilS [Candidatus Kapabacteria bacterium]
MVRHVANDATVLVAVSGGLDSVTLLHTIHRIQDSINGRCVVAHLNHGLRGAESDGDELSVIAHANLLGIPVFSERADVQGYAHVSGLGIEGAARELRYSFLTRIATEQNAALVLTAHTMDDNAETMLMNLARGSGTKGLSGIPPVRELTDSIRIVRPFIEFTRSEIHDVASVWGLQWREDSSNSDVQYLRNHVRAVVMPALREVFGPTVAGRLLRSSELIRDADSVLRSVVEDTLPSVTSLSVDGDLTLLVDSLLGLPPGLVREIIRAAVPCSHNDVPRISHLLEAEAGSSASLGEGRIAIRERDHILITKMTGEAPFPQVVIERDGAYVAGSQSLSVERRSVLGVQPLADPQVAYLDLSSLRGVIVWRPWQDGDRFQPFGLDGTVLVSDLLTNHRVPHADRRSIRVVCDDEGIVWVCGIRTAERTRVTSMTSEILTLTVSV